MVKEPGSRVEMIDQRRTGYALEQADRRPSLVPKREMRPLPDQGDTDLRSRRQTYGRPLPQEPQNAEPSHRQAKHQTFRTHQAAFRDDDRTSARGSPSRRHRERAPSSRERSPFSRERTPPSRSPVRTFEERERTGRYRDRGHYTPPRRALVPEDNRDDMTPRTPVYSREPPPRRWASVYDDEMGSRRAPAYEPVYRSRSSRYEAEDGRGRMRAPREYYRTEPIYNRRSTDNRRDLEPLRRPVKREISPDLRFQEPPTERVSEDRLVLRPTSTDLERGESVRGRSWQQGPLYIDAPQPPWSYRGSSVHPELHPLIPYPTAPTWQPNSFQPQMVAHVQAPPLDSGYSRLTDYYAPPSQYPPTYARGQGDQVPALHSQNQYARPSQYRIRTQGNGEGSSRQR
ncbi:hypothetical protein C8Q78DRAFT_206884 [Trametes maxima]|nr:hypothetical protein C8Q78DRAFT_206884 [Trametes maxima]